MVCAQKKTAHPYGSLRLSKSSLFSIYNVWEGGTYFNPLQLSKRKKDLSTVKDKRTWDTFGKRQQATTGQSLLHHSPECESNSFYSIPSIGGRRGKIIPILEWGLAALNSQDCSLGARLPNGFLPSDLGVDYFFSINPAGRREKFSSSEGHLALETEENAEQEKQLGWEREGEGTAFQQLHRKETLVICSNGLSHNDL